MVVFHEGFGGKGWWGRWWVRYIWQNNVLQMSENVALNVVIGLIFIYLLYSLLATVISEIIATQIGLRARNLKEAIDLMLNDEKIDDNGIGSRLWDTLKLTKNPDNERIEKFYNNPEIKYLGSTGIFKNPSSFKAVTFSRTLLYELNGSGTMDKNRIVAELLHSINPAATPSPHQVGTTDDHIATLDKQTAQFVLSLYNDSYGDLVKFKLQLEAWFDRTMEQATEWYRRKIQIILMAIGFLMAWFFNADTFTIISKLSTDKDARDKLVTVAVAYTQNYQQAPGIPNLSLGPEKFDSLNAIKQKLEQDVANANTILGIGGWPADTVTYVIDSKSGKKLYTPLIDELSLSERQRAIDNGIIPFSRCEKWNYLFRLLLHHFFGFLITAIAISLGAPFWYDLLNKLMKLRTSMKQETDSTNTNVSGNVSPLNREA